MQPHLPKGLSITEACEETILETGNGVFFTALNFALGVSTWSFSSLKFQACMGILLTFMLMPRKKRPYPGPEPGGHWH
ncbi:MAG: hypothetical protein ACK55V_10545 [Alphaproteobacteria bacterium]|jgi:predicted RND superfamily exporter protein